MKNVVNLSLLAVSVLAIVLLLGSNQRTATAQDEFADPAAPAAAAAAPAAPAGGPAAANAPPKPKKSYLKWTIDSLGWSYTIVFLAISIVLVTLIVMNLLALRRDNICPNDLVEGVDQQLTEGNAQGAAEVIRSDDSFLGQVLSAGLSNMDKGHEYAMEAMQEVGEEETMKLEHSLNYMALIGNISPMIGLLGTVQGMISSFEVIANSGTTPKPSELAGGISTALFTTLVGLLLAIPAIAIFNILRNRLQRLTMKVGITSEELLQRFEH